jgi:hypothetical protein
VQYKGRTISGLKEGAWVKYHGDTVVEVNYYYGDSLLFALPKADFVTTNFCIDSLSLCWKYPRSWTLEVNSDGIVAWSDRTIATEIDIARPVITFAALSLTQGEAAQIGSALVDQGHKSIAASADSLVVLEDIVVPVLNRNDYGRKLTCKVYKGGICYGLVRVTGVVNQTAVTVTGTAVCDNDVFIQKLAAFIEIASTLEHAGKPVFNRNGVWKTD